MSSSDRPRADQTRTYGRASSVVFLKTDEPFGGLSNMASGYPLHLEEVRILTTEALYQACRFPHLPAVQRLIIEQKSPMTAKMKSKPHRKDSRSDWDQVRIKIMRWCLRVKLAQNWATFSELLLRTGDRPIVEESRKDDFWGAKPVDEHTLVGMNVLGRLLMELRESIKADGREALLNVEPPAVPDFTLFGRPIGAIDGRGAGAVERASARVAKDARVDAGARGAEQTSLFEQPAVKEGPPPDYARTRAVRAGLTDLEPYPAMKGSGVPWLGRVPEHWDVLPNRALFTEVKERNHPDEQMLSVTITKGVIRQQALLADSSKKDSSNLDKSAYKLVRPGDIAYNKMRAWQGAVGVSRYRGIVSPAYVVQRPRDIADSRYLHYLLRTPAFAKEAERWSYGITSDMWSLRPEHFRMIYSCLPPLPEQAAIVRFLDRADRCIWRYIRAKQKLIKLLEEQTQIVIHRAVTRGLDTNVRLKPSGVEWLGDVPEHWEVRRIKAHVDVRDGTHDTPEYVSPGESTFPLVTSRHVREGKILVEVAPHITKADYDEIARRSVVAKGDIVMPMIGTIGNPCIVETNTPFAIKNVALFRTSVSKRLLPEYLCVLLSSTSIRRQIDDLSRGGVQGFVGLNTLRNLFLSIPALDEQEAILSFLREATQQDFAAVTSSQREISLLREYRTRLIADVVTGKLDVREAAARLSDEIEEPEPRDEADAEDAAADDVDAVPEDAEA